jgi:putative glycosyltransferase
MLDPSRNFGHHKAMMTGLAHAAGDLVFLLDSDLEEAPELLDTFHQEMIQSGADVIYGVQQRRKGSRFEQWSGKAFYSVFNLLSEVQVPRDVLTARLMTRRYVQSLVEHRDREVFLLGLWTITGFKQVALTVQKQDKGSTAYSLRHKISVLVNSVTSFSDRPLVMIFYLGCLILVASTVSAFSLVVRRLFFDSMLLGWASVIVSIWFIGGLIMFALGVIGIYLAKVFSETKERPYTVLRHHYQHSPQKVKIANETPASVGER